MKAGKHIGSLWQEFKAFAFKGNMIDLAVAVVIGAAFSGVINSLVKDVIMPSVIYVTTTVNTVAKKTVDAAEKTAAVVGVTSKPAETQPAGTQPADAAGTATAVTKTAEEDAKAKAEAAKAEADKAAAKVAADKEAADKANAGKPVQLDWKIGPVNIGSFIGELLNFVLIAAAVFIVIVKLLGSVMKRVGGTPAPSEPTTKECPFCLSVIPLKARKCAHCTADQPASPTAGAVG